MPYEDYERDELRNIIIRHSAEQISVLLEKHDVEIKEYEVEYRNKSSMALRFAKSMEENDVPFEIALSIAETPSSYIWGAE